MKRSNFWAFIPLLVLGFIGWAVRESFCPTKDWCIENRPLGLVLMIIGFGGWAVSMFVLFIWNNRGGSK